MTSVHSACARKHTRTQPNFAQALSKQASFHRNMTGSSCPTLPHTMLVKAPCLIFPFHWPPQSETETLAHLLVTLENYCKQIYANPGMTAFLFPELRKFSNICMIIFCPPAEPCTSIPTAALKCAGMGEPAMQVSFLTYAAAVGTLTSGCRSHHLRRHKQDREQQKPLQSFETGPVELEGDAGVHVIQNASRQKSMPHSLLMSEIYPLQSGLHNRNRKTN